MSDAVTDTHGLIWYLANDPLLSPAASQAFEQCDRGEIAIHVPTMCLVEMVYLQEKGNIPAQLKARFDSVLQTGTSGLILADLTADIVDTLARIPRTSVPDLPDRIIAATAVHLNLPLITKDKMIQASGISIIW